MIGNGLSGDLSLIMMIIIIIMQLLLPEITYCTNSEIIRKQNNYEKVEHISPEQPYRLKPENRAQITRDNPGDMYLLT